MPQSSAHPVLWTIGHSNRELSELIGLLTAQSIAQLADVRRFPGSRRHPQFGRDRLSAELGAEGIAYRHFPQLGGRRGERLADSPNTAWRVEAFNAYADHMRSEEFQAALGELEALARTRRTAIMCSEAVPWRCHRRLIADALIVRGWAVEDIIGGGAPRPHALTDFATVRDGIPIYPGQTLF